MSSIPDPNDPTNQDQTTLTATTPTTVETTAPSKETYPDIESIASVVLKDGPRVRKVAKFGVIRSRHTGEIHHDALSIQTFRKKQGQLIRTPEHSVSLSSDGEDEIQPLIDLLVTARQHQLPKEDGTYVIASEPGSDADRTALKQIIHSVVTSGEYDLFAQAMSTAGKDARLFATMLERAAMEPQLFIEAAAALNLATYRNAVGRLRELIESSEKPTEHDFQNLLEANPWMFGSEYSQLLDRRRWTRDEQQDFVVRRTTDGFIELIEIKTPLAGKPLFLHDPSHMSFFAGAELSKVIGQVQKYIERLDAGHDAIKANDGEDTAKVRAKVIIGRDLDAEQVKALRRFNGHLHRIEVITFDQLLNIAERVLSYLDGVIQPSPEYSS